MREFLRTSVAALLFVGLMAAPAAANKQFNPGALILPPGSAYQTDCGSVAIYGLVYDVLRANAWLAAHPALAPGGQIEMYYAYNDLKTSPNRCTPTNKNTDPTISTAWIDGCDFSITDNTKTPVKEVNHSAVAAANDTNIVTRSTTADATGTNPKIYPGYASVTVDFAAGVNTVRYLGGPLIIDDVDATTFLKLIDGSLIAYDSQGNAIDFSPFSANKGACNFGSDNGGYVSIHRAKAIFSAPAIKQFTAAPPRLALLATTAGVATVDIEFPAQLSLSNSPNGAKETGTTATFTTTANHNLAAGDVVKVTGVGVAGYNGTWTVATASGKTFTATITSSGLGTSGGGKVQRAGIWESGTTVTAYTTANHGFATGYSVDVANLTGAAAAYNGTWTVTSVPTTKKFTFTHSTAGLAADVGDSGGDVTRTVAGSTRKVSNNILQKYLKLAGLQFTNAGGCPPGGLNVGDTSLCPSGGTRGQIYDTFDFADITSGKLDSNYKMIWTPHWELTSASGGSSDPNAGEQTAINKISTFLNGQTGLMAECHSIASFEGTYSNGGVNNNADSSSGSSSLNGQRGIGAGQFQTCVGSAGACSGGSTPYGMNKDVANPAKSTYWRNCSDPNMTAGAACTYYSAPGDPFAQPGDFTWNNQTGSVQNFLPNTAVGAIYKPGVSPLISGVLSLNATKLTSVATARSMVVADYATRSTKDNDTTKGNIVYVAGHDVSGVVSGSKVILQTLLLLGEPPIITVTTEVSRASPITSTVTNSSGTYNVVVQGSYEKVTPPTTTTQVKNNGTSVTSFVYPDVLGHLRAYDTANVTTAQQDFEDIASVFDAADGIPDTSQSYSPGCGANAFGAGSGGCRTIFTHTATGYAPARVILDSSASTNSTLNNLMNGTDPPLTSNFDLFIKRIIAGRETSFGSGVYAAKLGGVDRSTVAVVPSSLVAGTARPKVIYFGASDGMLHAVCGSIAASQGCDILGRELWAFIPRSQLGQLRNNAAKIDGSPRVMDIYGDFTTGTGGGTKSFRTIMMFQSGNGDAAVANMHPSVTALDITNPNDPKIVFAYDEPGQGLVLSAGPVRLGGVFKNYAFVTSNNSGTATVGNNVAAVDLETGSTVWTNSMTFPIASIGRAGGAPPDTAIPGGAVGVDKQQTGSITDVVFPTLYGEVWQVDATTGISRHGTNPLFRWTTDKHPFGSSPAIYANSGQLYAIVASGGYADLSTSPTLWSEADQKVFALWLQTPTTDAPLTETSGTPDVAWHYDLINGDRSFAQAVVVGGEVFITADSDDVNSSTYGVGAHNTGHIYQLNVTNGNQDNLVVVRGGAGSVNTNASGSEVYNLTKDKAQKVVASTSTGDSPGSVNTAHITRLLWLRTL